MALPELNSISKIIARFLLNIHLSVGCGQPIIDAVTAAENIYIFYIMQAGIAWQLIFVLQLKEECKETTLNGVVLILRL